MTFSLYFVFYNITCFIHYDTLQYHVCIIFGIKYFYLLTYQDDLGAFMHTVAQSGIMYKLL